MSLRLPCVTRKEKKKDREETPHLHTEIKIFYLELFEALLSFPDKSLLKNL